MPEHNFYCRCCDVKFNAIDMLKHTYYNNKIKQFSKMLSAEQIVDTEEDVQISKRKVQSDVVAEKPVKKQRSESNADTVLKKDNEVIVIDDDHISDKQYVYFCLQCEELLNDFEENSTNVKKIRVPLTVDIASHIVSTGHGKFAPIQDSTRVDIQNISLKREFSKSIIKQWKKMALNEEIDVKKYKDPKAVSDVMNLLMIQWICLSILK